MSQHIETLLYELSQLRAHCPQLDVHGIMANTVRGHFQSHNAEEQNRHRSLAVVLFELLNLLERVARYYQMNPPPPLQTRPISSPLYEQCAVITHQEVISYLNTYGHLHPLDVIASFARSVVVSRPQAQTQMAPPLASTFASVPSLPSAPSPYGGMGAQQYGSGLAAMPQPPLGNLPGMALPVTAIAAHGIPSVGNTSFGAPSLPPPPSYGSVPGQVYGTGMAQGMPSQANPSFGALNLPPPPPSYGSVAGQAYGSSVAQPAITNMAPVPSNPVNLVPNVPNLPPPPPLPHGSVPGQASGVAQPANPPPAAPPNGDVPGQLHAPGVAQDVAQPANPPLGAPNVPAPPAHGNAPGQENGPGAIAQVQPHGSAPGSTVSVNRQAPIGPYTGQEFIPAGLQPAAQPAAQSNPSGSLSQAQEAPRSSGAILVDRVAELERLLAEMSSRGPPGAGPAAAASSVARPVNATSSAARPAAKAAQPAVEEEPVSQGSAASQATRPPQPAPPAPTQPARRSAPGGQGKPTMADIAARAPPPREPTPPPKRPLKPLAPPPKGSSKAPGASSGKGVFDSNVEAHMEGNPDEVWPDNMASNLSLTQELHKQVRMWLDTWSTKGRKSLFKTLPDLFIPMPMGFESLYDLKPHLKLMADFARDMFISDSQHMGRPGKNNEGWSTKGLQIRFDKSLEDGHDRDTRSLRKRPVLVKQAYLAYLILLEYREYMIDLGCNKSFSEFMTARGPACFKDLSMNTIMERIRLALNAAEDYLRDHWERATEISRARGSAGKHAPTNLPAKKPGPNKNKGPSMNHPESPQKALVTYKDKGAKKDPRSSSQRKQDSKAAKKQKTEAADHKSPTVRPGKDLADADDIQRVVSEIRQLVDGDYSRAQVLARMQGKFLNLLGTVDNPLRVQNAWIGLHNDLLSSRFAKTKKEADDIDQLLVELWGNDLKPKFDKRKEVFKSKTVEQKEHDHYMAASGSRFSSLPVQHPEDTAEEAGPSRQADAAPPLVRRPSSDPSVWSSEGPPSEVARDMLDGDEPASIVSGGDVSEEQVLHDQEDVSAEEDKSPTPVSKGKERAMQDPPVDNKTVDDKEYPALPPAAAPASPVKTERQKKFDEAKKRKAAKAAEKADAKAVEKEAEAGQKGSAANDAKDGEAGETEAA